ncbi:MAG: hypothetical protein BZ138_00955 [Methanosphaera sp. rholeuAM270]|nr:MAG: hypothetical protein BZ138_00955 [Methanosphaera sp. rholeuAM270]
MKMLCHGIDISDNDVSCSDLLISNVEDSLYRIRDAGATHAILSNVTGDDIVVTAVIEDDSLLENVNKAVYDCFKDNALGFDDLNGVGLKREDAGEGISYVELDLNPDFYPDAVVISFDTYCGEYFVGDVACSAVDAAKGMKDVYDVKSSVIKGVSAIPGVGFVSSQTDDPVVVASVNNVEQIGVVAGAMIGAILGNKNTYLVKRGTPINVIPGSVIFSVTAIMNGNPIDLSENFAFRSRIME